MKILNLCPEGKQKNPYNGDEVEYDLDATSSIIKEIISTKFGKVELVSHRNMIIDGSYVAGIANGKFDLCIYNLTTYNVNISYLAGIAEASGIPIIFYASSDHADLPVMSHRRTLLYSEISLENEFAKALNDEIQKIIDNPAGYFTKENNITKKPKAFISYSHVDKEYLNRLMVHLKPLERDGLLDIWQDSKIKVGDHWKEEINTALAEANIAILLISADFLASDFIINNELPPLLSKAEAKGTKIVPLILTHCRFSRDSSLNKFQAVNEPNEPLSILNKEEREAIFDMLSFDIEKALRET